MNLVDALGITRGVAAVVGSGGKTTLLAALAEELADAGATVALTTTTHILPFAGVRTLDGSDAGEVAAALADAPAGKRVVCAASPTAGEKLAAPACGVDALARAADYVLVEADGSRRLPLKAHEAWEPVVPEGAGRVILVVGASGFGRPVAEVAHRPERFCALAGCAAGDVATPALVARVIAAEGLADVVVVNQAEAPEALLAARELADALDVPVLAGSIRAHALRTA